jgi:TonB-linked SusC/RagA family outer membrane protein
MKKPLKSARRYKTLLKLNLKMKLSVLIIALTFFSMQANESYGQLTKLSLNVIDITVVDLIEQIESTSEFRFIYKKRDVDLNREISLKTKNSTLDKILSSIFKNTSTSFKIKDRRVYLVPKIDVIPAKKIIVPKVEMQQSTSGNVKDQKGGPLPGASIVEKGTTNGVITDFDGNFTISTDKSNTTLIVSYLGFITKEILTKGKTNLNIILEEDSARLDEVVVIGYGTATKKNLTGSISSLKSEELEDQPIASFDQGLAGRLAGVDISQSGGAPGGAVNINIRGVASISGGNSPLIVIDGVPLSSSTNDSFSQGQSTNSRFDAGYSINPLSTINPSDISSVEVLKDAAAAAIYGSRGSNGVIIITTKRGRNGDKPKINFNVYGGFQNVIKKVDVMNAQEFAEYSKLARDNSWIARDPLNNSASDPQDIRSAQDSYAPYLIPYLNGETGLTDTDWQDEIFRTAAIQSYDLSIAGGNEKTNYFISGNHLNQEGIVINSGVKRYGARINFETEISDNMRFGINLNPSFTNNNIVQTEANWWKEGVIQTALMYHPNLEPRNADGTLRLGELLATGQSGQSVVALIENPIALAELIENSLDQTRILGNTFFEYKFASDFTFKTSFAADFNYLDRFYYRPKNLNIRFEPTPTTNFNYAWSNNSTSLNLLTENTLKYDKEFDRHSINLLLGQSAQKETNKRQYLEGRNFPNDNVRTLNAAQATDGFSEERRWSLLSYFGRASYNYNDIYLISASLRRDGSSRFGANTKWGWFPSVSAGWRLSNEEFWSDESVFVKFHHIVDGISTLSGFSLKA